MADAKRFIGIDIGGTFIKGMIISEKGKYLIEDTIPTPRGNDELIRDIKHLIQHMIRDIDAEKEDFIGVGIGCPGLVDSKNGVVIFAGNLGMKDYPIRAKAEAAIGLPVKVTNDANAAALGEARFGAGKEYENSVLITLGTGVGSGIIINRKLYEGGRSAGAEIGHMVIVEHGLHCTCGRKGCFEAYSSATALRKKTVEVMRKNLKSKMWDTYDLETASGKTAFDYKDTDDAARDIIDWYIKYLSVGVTNVANIFRPDIIMLGGGLSQQKENLYKPVQKFVDEHILGGQEYAPVKVVTASLGNRAGVIGAAALFMD